MKKKQNNKRIAGYSVAVILTASVLSGFVSLGDHSPKMFKTDDPITGMYYFYGTKISTIYPCTWTCFDMEPAVDTTSVAFTANVWLVEEKRDTLRFFGLLGADAGERGRHQFGEFVFPIVLYGDEEQKVYATLRNSNGFEINLNSTGERYTATGSFTGNTIQLEGQYHYRQRTFEYDLQGVRIEEE